MLQDQVSMAVVVVLPWVPATASTWRPSSRFPLATGRRSKGDAGVEHGLHAKVASR